MQIYGYPDPGKGVLYLGYNTIHSSSAWQNKAHYQISCVFDEHAGQKVQVHFIL